MAGSNEGSCKLHGSSSDGKYYSRGYSRSYKPVPPVSYTHLDVYKRQELNKAGVLEKYNVQVIGVQVDAIERGEDRIEFKKAMNELGIEMAVSYTHLDVYKRQFHCNFVIHGSLSFPDSEIASLL